jgi:hypothetical protein
MQERTIRRQMEIIPKDYLAHAAIIEAALVEKDFSKISIEDAMDLHAILNDHLEIIGNFIAFKSKRRK